ncbi:MAG: family 20 glycosylhydrolase, partial [Phycisphaerae bacterium]|nr:family 20 glycosylhydrolase [Phycisphaerae bacterium]
QTFLPDDHIVDWPDLPMRGFHLDMTCQSLSFEYVCSLLERMAGLKYNALLLEWGDKFPYQGHRTLSHPDAFTTRQVSQLLELADGLGVVVIPLVQTLGHVEFILRHPQFAHLSEIPGEISQLATGHPESLILAKQLVDQLIESHPNSPYIHLGADDTTQLGAGISAEQVARKGKSLVWVEYMNVVCRHVQARGRTPIVWDDMLLGHPQALNRFTRDCLLMHWNYSATEAVAEDYFQPGIGRVNARSYKTLEIDLRERYERFWSMGGAKPPRTFFTQAPVAYLQEAGFKVILAPSVRSQGDSYSAPRVRQHIANCFQMAQAAAQHGSLGMMVTSWSVRRTPIEATVPALIAAAEAAWNGGRAARSLDAQLAGEIAARRAPDLIKTFELIGRSGIAMLNGIATDASAWDRRRERWGIAPLIGRIRKADIHSQTASSEAVKVARAVQRESRTALNRLARVTTAPRMHPTLIPAWRYAARETGHKAAHWLYLWQLLRFVRVDRGSAETLARQGAALLEDIRRCMREFKRAVGPSLAGSGLEEELDVHFGSEARLIRRVVRTLRSRQPRIGIRGELAEMFGLPDPGEKERQ